MIEYLKKHFKTNKLKDLDFLYSSQKIDFSYYSSEDIEQLLLYKLFCLLALKSYDVIVQNKNKRYGKCQLNPKIVQQLPNLRLCIECFFGQYVPKIEYNDIQIFDSENNKISPLALILQQLITSNKPVNQQIQNICQIYEVYLDYLKLPEKEQQNDE